MICQEFTQLVSCPCCRGPALRAAVSAAGMDASMITSDGTVRGWVIPCRSSTIYIGGRASMRLCALGDLGVILMRNHQVADAASGSHRAAFRMQFVFVRTGLQVSLPRVAKR